MWIAAIRGISGMKEVTVESEAPDDIRARAIEWHVRLRDGDGATWEAFAEWLAEDPRHAGIYDEIEQADLAIEDLLPDMIFREAANDVGEPFEAPVRRTRHRRYIGGALVASIAAAIALAPQLTSNRYEVVTAPGERRTVSLDAGTQVILNGATRMTFDRDDPRFAALTEGEALFDVRHDSSRPFALEVGGNRVEDAGTVFNVVHQAGEVRVAVAEGRIVYNPEQEAISLDAGQALVDRSDANTVRVSRVSIEAVGAWRTGRLVYSAAPLSQVAADLGRALGVRIVVAPAIADRLFSGAIVLDSRGPEQLKRLQLALDVALDAGPDGWVMKPISGAGR